MWIRLVPGLVMTIVLGFFFSLENSDIGRDLEKSPVRDKPPAAQTGNYRGFFRFPEIKPPSRTTTAARTIPLTGTVPIAEEHDFIDSGTPLLMGEPLSKAIIHTPTPPASTLASVNSGSAFASLSPWEFADPNAIPMGDLSPQAMEAIRADLPARGISTWIMAEAFKSKQKELSAGTHSYSQNGSRYRLGAKYDWSIDSVIGVALDVVDRKLKSDAAWDKRENNTTGYIANAIYESAFLGLYPLNLNAFYGRFETDGKGWVTGGGAGAPRRRWSEKKHDSSLLGFSGRIGVPLLYGNDIKVLPEIGITFQRLSSKAYQAGVEGLSPVRVPRMSSTSLSIPMQVTVKKDFLQGWGIVTPRLQFGATVETDDSAAGVRALHASGGSPFAYDPATGFHSATLEFERKDKGFFHVNLGVDILSVGGWKVAADFTHQFVDKYTSSAFTLELGRCF